MGWYLVYIVNSLALLWKHWRFSRALFSKMCVKAERCNLIDSFVCGCDKIRDYFAQWGYIFIIIFFGLCVTLTF